MPVGLLYPQSTVEIATSYADSGVYQFSHVFDESYNTGDVFNRVTPVVWDAFQGVNGAILVRGKRRGWLPGMQVLTTA